MNPKKIFDRTACRLKRMLPVPVLVFLMTVLCSGCSAGTGYWTNRLDDAKDIFSLTMGRGFGVKVQAGPVQADTMYNYASRYGLRGGEFLPGRIGHSGEYHVSEGNIGVPLLFCNTEIFFPGKHAAARGKAYCAMTPLLPVFILLPEAHTTAYCNSCSRKRKAEQRKLQKEKYAELPPEEQKKIRGGLAPLTKAEKKVLNEALDKENSPNLPFDGQRAWHKYSDIEVTAALGVGFSFGINPGELLDFLAGFAGFDLYRDDI